MEEWRQSLGVSDDFDRNPEYKVWKDDDHLLGDFHDPSEKWKPPEAVRTRGYSISKSIEDPDILIQAVQDTTTTTLIEKETCAEDVIKVWDEVAKFIVEKMKEGFGVKIAGLGTFTYCEEKYIDKGDRLRLFALGKENEKIKKQSQDLKEKTRKIPFMILSEFIVRMYNLITPLDETLCTIPTCPLNLSAITYKTKLPRRIIDGIMTDVLQSFSRAVVLNKNVEFPFPNIGKLQISKRKVVFKFYAEFCVQLGFEALDSEGYTDPADPFILPGTMTPLRRHIPTADFCSVFHLREVRSVRPCDLLAPVKWSEVDGKFVATSGLDPETPFLAESEVKDLRPWSSKRIRKKDLFGSQLQHRYTISWVREKRDYLKFCKDHDSGQPWPRHRFHVVESSVALNVPSPPPTDTTKAGQSDDCQHPPRQTDDQSYELYMKYK